MIIRPRTLPAPEFSMISALLRHSTNSRRQANGQSPFSSPLPEVSQQGPPDERSPLLEAGTSGTDGDGEDQAVPNAAAHEFDTENEDGVRDETPLLPIFSAAHLGLKLSIQIPCQCTFTDADRCSAHLQLDSHLTSSHHVQVRDYIDLGPASFATGVTISP